MTGDGPVLVDLHLHTTASDGADPPLRVMELARRLGLQAIAITDHDSMAGYLAARASAGPELISGVELSVQADGREIHVLGYFCDPDKLRIDQRTGADRERRNRELLARLRRDGVDISMEELRVRKPFGSIGRPLIAAILVERGLFPDTAAAFDCWLAEGRPYYVPRQSFTLEEAAAVIRSAGGKAVLAHPLQYRLPEAGLRALVGRCKEAGFSGLEALYSGYSGAERAALSGLAAAFQLRVTGGSDYHGPQRPHCPMGGVAVPYSLLEALRNGN